MGIAAEHPDGRHDRDETAVAGLVEHPADFLDLFADLDRKAARRFLRRQYLGALVNFELRMVEEDVRSEEHRSELQSLMRISYAVFCLKKKINHKHTTAQHL